MVNHQPIITCLDKVSPLSYVVDVAGLKRNMACIDQIKEQTGATLLLALKAFAMSDTFEYLTPSLDGVTASSINEATLAQDHFKKELHVYAPCYSEADFSKLCKKAHHVTFNSVSQWAQFKPQLHRYAHIQWGLRINPQHSEVATAMYDPCAPGSRLGVPLDQLTGQDLTGLSGFLIHTLCEKNADALERTVRVIEDKFGDYLHSLEWLNLGGGHHITQDNYDMALLISLINRLQSTYNLRVILEPGEAIALNAGYLVATVMDVLHYDIDIAILNTSATAHMPDVLEMPYRPEVIGAGDPGEFQYTYRLGGATCLSGDVIGNYSFKQPLSVGDKLIFCDMAHYTMVKTTMFNGINLPDTAILHDNGHLETVQSYGYDHYIARL